MKKILLISLLCLMALAQGCQYRSYQEGSASYTSMSLGTSQTLAPFKITAGKRDDPSYRELDSQGLATDQSALAAGISAGLNIAKRP